MIAASELTVFTGLWPVEAKYKVVQREVRVTVPTDLSKPRLIEPGSFPGIAEEFSEVESEEQLLAFTHRFGLLGYARLFPLVEKKKKYGGDPVNWSLGHARRVATAFAIFQLIEQGPKATQDQLPGVLRSINLDFMGSNTRGEELEKRLLIKTGKTKSYRDDDGKEKESEVILFKPGALFDADWPGDPLRVAWRVLAHLINGQIRGLRVEVSEEQLRPVFAFDALLQIIYWQAAGELKNLHLRRCESCRKFFPAKRSDAKTCSAKCRVKKSRGPIVKKRRKKR